MTPQEASFSALKENTYRESNMRREVEFKLQSLSAEMGGAQLREQELSQQLDDMNVQVGKRGGAFDLRMGHILQKLVNITVGVGENERLIRDRSVFSR